MNWAHLTASSGEIRGPKSKTGKDNQIIKVAGGEVFFLLMWMEVPGVADLVQNLIQTFSTLLAGSNEMANECALHHK